LKRSNRSEDRHQRFSEDIHIFLDPLSFEPARFTVAASIGGSQTSATLLPATLHQRSSRTRGSGSVASAKSLDRCSSKPELRAADSQR
jgi:hypothetical protein